MKEFLQLSKLAAAAFINWMFRSHLVTATETNGDGFHLYHYEGTPSVTPGFFIVRYRHVFNGEVKARHRLRMTEHEWAETVDMMEQRKQEAA